MVGGSPGRGQAKFLEHEAEGNLGLQAGCHAGSVLWPRGEAFGGDRLMAGGPIRPHCSLPGGR